MTSTFSTPNKDLFHYNNVLYTRDFSTQSSQNIDSIVTINLADNSRADFQMNGYSIVSIDGDSSGNAYIGALHLASSNPHIVKLDPINDEIKWTAYLPRENVIVHFG
jgi:hypothetical protein